MKIKELQQELIEAYDLQNLNKISLTLINLYKNREYSQLQKIAEIISDYVDIKITAEGKGFSKLIMLYHPDRATYYLSEINSLAKQNNFDGLRRHAHILKLERIEEIAQALPRGEDIDYSPVYDWDLNTEGYSIITDREPIKKGNTRPLGYNFYDAIKVREYGHTGIEFPSWYLEDLDEFELASSNVNDLEGIQFCLHARRIDLSDNQITDLSLLEGLSYIEELNLSDNQIGMIDPLSYLPNLKRIFLSNNEIEDITPLFELNKLEFVDLSGNKVDMEQLRELRDLGVTVDL